MAISDIGAGVSIIGNLDTNADTDVFTVNMRAGEVYDFWMAPEPGFGDPITDATIEISRGATTLADDNDSAEGTAPGNATLLFVPTAAGPAAAGDFTVTASEVTATGNGGHFVLTVVNKSLIDDVSDHIVGTDNTGPTFDINGIGTNAVLAEEDIVTSEIIDRADADSDADVYAVFLVVGQTYDFSVLGADAGVTNGISDAHLRLLDADGVELSSGGAAGGSSDAAITFGPVLVADQWAFLEVTGNSSATGAYTLQFDDLASGGPIAYDVPATTGPTATFASNPFNLPLGDTIRGDIEVSGDQDWYAIHLVQGFTYHFEAAGGTLGNLVLDVRDDTGALVPGAAASGAEPQTLDFTPTSSAVFYIDVHGQGAGDTGSFTLSSALVSAPGAVPVHSITGIGGTIYIGSDQTDAITGGTEADTIDGALGNDTLAGGLGGDSIVGGASLGLDLGGNDSLSGDAGNDTLKGQDGDDTLDGGADRDTLDGQDGDDTLDGGADDDSIQGGNGSDSALGGLGADFIDVGSSLSSDTADGGAGNDTIFGSPGSGDLLIGGIGDDAVQSYGSNDTVLGGIGNDNLTGVFATGPTSIDGGVDQDSIFGSAFADTLTGGDGNDTIDGYTGINLLNGGNGNDTFNNVDAGDLITAGAGVDQINSRIGWTLRADEENLTLIGGDTVNGNGNTGSNVIFGNNQANQLRGLGGSNSLLGGAGNDTLIGGAGKDLNTGGAGLDHIKYNALSDSGATFASRDAINTFAHGDKIDLSVIDANSNLAGNQAFTFSSGQALTGQSGLLIVQQVATNAFLVLADVNGDHAADFSLNVYTSPGFGTFHAFDFIL